MARTQRLLAIFAYVDDTVHALRSLKAEKMVSVETVYSPARNHELEHIMEVKPSPVRLFVLCGGIFGIVFGFALGSYAAAQWRFVVWAKPPIPIVPFVILSFEFCILMSILFGVVGLLLLSRMPKIKTPAHFDAGFTVDRFGVLLNCPHERSEKIRKMLQEAGAEEVRDARL